MSDKCQYLTCCDIIKNLKKKEYSSKNFTEQERQAIELYKDYYSEYLKVVNNLEDIPDAYSNTKFLDLVKKLASLESSLDIQNVIDKVNISEQVIQATFADEYFIKTKKETYEQREKELDEQRMNKRIFIICMALIATTIAALALWSRFIS